MFPAKILFFLITSTFFLQCTSQEKQVHLRGTPEADYPTYYAIPKTSFRCSDQLHNPGFYADTETRCQVFHYCYEHRQESFLCPMGTIFNQPILACDYWYSSNCSLAPSYYNVNAIKRDEYLFEADDPLDFQSENLFDKMADLYEINKTPESPFLNDSVSPENEMLSKESIESSSKPFAEKNNQDADYNKYSYDKQFNIIDEKQPEIVKYDVIGLNAVNDPKRSENEQPYEIDNSKDFIFSADGMLHPSQEDIYQMHPTDMNFDQGYSGYAEIPSEGNFNYGIYDDSENDVQIPDFELQRRNSVINGNYVRKRPSSRKPIVITEVEPERVQLPVTKLQRKPIKIASTVSTNADSGSSYGTAYDPNVYSEEIVSVANEDFEGTASGEFPLDERNSDLKFNGSKLLYESLEEIKDKSASQQHQMDSSSIIYDSIKKRTRNAHVLSNVEDEISHNIVGSGSNDFLSISNGKHRTLAYSNYVDESEVFTENAEGSIILPDESSDTTVESGIIYDNEEFLGSGSEENTQPHLSDGSSFPEDQGIFFDSEDTEITDMETPYVLPMNLPNSFEGSGISVQETADMPNSAEEVYDPSQFVLKYDSEGNFEYGRETRPLSSSENNEVEELVHGGRGETSEFNYLPHELQESSNNLQDGSDKTLQDGSVKTVPEIREIDGTYYVFSDSEYHPYYEFDDSIRSSPENVDYVVAENFEDVLDKASEELSYSKDFQNVPEDSKLKIDYIGEETTHTLDYRDSSHLENTPKLSNEFETEISAEIPEVEYTVDDLETATQFSNEDLKFLEIMSQTPIPMLKNLFEVSEKASSAAIEDELPRTEIMSSDQDIIDQSHEYPVSLEEVREFESPFSDTTSDAEKNYIDTESSDIHSEILGTEQKIVEEASDTDGSDQDGIEVLLPEQNFEVFVSGKENDPFNPLFAEDNEILDGPESKQKLSVKAPPVKPKISLASPIISKELKKVPRGKRLSENLRTFNPPNKGNPLMVSRKETFREAVFTSIPSEFLKMKHSTLRPYFYNYGLKNSGYNPRTGDLFKSSKLSKVTSFGKRLLAAKRAKFNIIKKYIDSYGNN